jgi:4-amino-4-deoxy-L-arabinose transferase-like glycosyltransferase
MSGHPERSAPGGPGEARRTGGYRPPPPRGPGWRLPPQPGSGLGTDFGPLGAPDADADPVSRPARSIGPAPAQSRSPGLSPPGDQDLRPPGDQDLRPPGDQDLRPPGNLEPAADEERPATLQMPKVALDEPDSAKPSVPRKRRSRRTWLSRAVLLAVLCAQAVLTLQMHNTAFEDEALYLYAGHMELNHWLHGTALQGAYATYFSGAPILYPALGAAVATVGGLAAARAVSLIAMLAATALLYSLTRQLFNERVGLCAAMLFSFTEATIFLGNLATYDASALCLLALASWIVVRTAASRWPLYLLATPVAGLAVATKYAALLFVPTIAVLAGLAAAPRHGRWALIRPAAFVVAEFGLLAGALRLAGPSYLRALEGTTTARAHGTTPTMTLLRDSLLWGGLPFLLALAGVAAYAWRARTEPGERIAPSGGWLRRVALGAVLAGTALLAPAYQIHLHTDVSFQKHVGFGLFFAAPMAGIGLARIVGDHFRRAQMGIVVWGVSLTLGMVQATTLFNGWPDSHLLVQELALNLKPGAHYLVEVPEVPIYYLMGNRAAQPDQFTSTYNITYIGQHGQTLTGTAGFMAAVKSGYFRVIAYDNAVTPALDRKLASELESDPSYRLAASIPQSDSFGRTTYLVWVKRQPPPGSRTSRRHHRSGRRPHRGRGAPSPATGSR